MAIFDGRLIDPSERDLANTLGKAMKAANRENRDHGNRMSRDAAFWGRFALDVLRSGREGRRRSSKGGRAVPEVVAGWWTDPAGRKHIRIVGRTRQRYARLRRETEMRELPPWWHVYPEAVLGVRGKKEGERYFAVCRCGAVGSPESLGWMGDTCGPCFDRRADGGTPAGGFGQFNGWSPSASRFGFTPDGRCLIGQNRRGCFWKVNRDDGTSVTAKRRSINHLTAMGTNDTATTMVMQEGSVFRWPTDADEVASLVPSRQVWGRIAIVPDGSRVTIFSYQTSHVADLTAKRPKYTDLAAVIGCNAVQFTPDGSRLFVSNHKGELLSVNPETMTSEVIRPDASDGLMGFGPVGEMSLTRDGSALLIRRESYHPRRVSVRHVPLPAGKVVELRLPDWHSPTTLAYSPDGRHAITAESKGGWVGFWDVANGKSLGFVRAVLEDLAWRSGQIEFAPDNSAVAVSYNSGYGDHGATIAVWPWPNAMLAAAEG